MPTKKKVRKVRDRDDPSRRGRPCLLTYERKARLLGAVEMGLPLKHAAMFAGISYDTLNRWKLRGEAADAPLRFRHFCKALQRSQAVAMLKLVSRIQKAGENDWKAAAWMLERRFPDEFVKPLQIEHSGPGGKPIEPPPMVTHDVLQRIKKQEGLVRMAGKLGAMLTKIREEKLQARRAHR